MAVRKKKRKAKRRPAKKKAKSAKPKPKGASKKPAKSSDAAGNGGQFKPGVSGNPAGRKKGVPNKATIEVKALAHEMLTDEKYLKSLARRLHGGKLAPGMEAMLFHYAFGKPIERIKHSGESFASIVMAVANRPDPAAEDDQ